MALLLTLEPADRHSMCFDVQHLDLRILHVDKHVSAVSTYADTGQVNFTVLAVQLFSSVEVIDTDPLFGCSDNNIIAIWGDGTVLNAPCTRPSVQIGA